MKILFVFTGGDVRILEKPLGEIFELDEIQQASSSHFQLFQLTH